MYQNGWLLRQLYLTKRLTPRSHRPGALGGPAPAQLHACRQSAYEGTLARPEELVSTPVIPIKRIGN